MDGWLEVLDHPPGFPYTPPGVDVLEEGKLTSNNVRAVRTTLCSDFGCQRCCFQTRRCDAAGQDALHSAGVEGSEDAGAHSKLPQRLRKKRH